MWIVNKHGVIHEIPNDRPAPAGSRPATNQEVAEWRKQDERRKSAIKDQKQVAKVAAAKFVVTTGGDNGELEGVPMRDLQEYRADPAVPNLPYQDPNELHSPRPAVYPPTGEAYNPLTGLPYRADPGGPRVADPARDLAGLPYDPATGDFLRVTPATPLDPNVTPPDGQPGGKPHGADPANAITPGDSLEVVTDDTARTPGGQAAVNPPKSDDKGKGKK